MFLFWTTSYKEFILIYCQAHGCLHAQFSIQNFSLSVYSLNVSPKMPKSCIRELPVLPIFSRPASVLIFIHLEGGLGNPNNLLKATPAHPFPPPPSPTLGPVMSIILVVNLNSWQANKKMTTFWTILYIFFFWRTLFQQSGSRTTSLACFREHILLQSL